MTVRVLIADDQPLMRGALRACLDYEPDITVVAEASDGRQAVELVARHAPDVAVLDIRMPVLDGVQATRLIVEADAPRTKVLVVTSFDLDDYILGALRAGASGFLLKDATPDELVRAVRVLAAGDALLAPAVTRRLLEHYARFLPSPDRVREDAGLLTPRERAVLRLIAQGFTNTQIAHELYLAESSVKTHIGHLLAKLKAPDRVHLVIHAYDIGLVQPSGGPGTGWPPAPPS
ncbi:MAG TPA: response regulator transcription factor [Intrasporangium sp.]|uniref:response regulator transcription factor n=1 Tax=Intrasporangium sp. TaxID=1925024 RepID=UPI002D76EDD7|nr:response regulator transcription factor [Intrasporangium sp.]HET7398005.1 response regulator transcription factor [Intrasporangium sp.]